jgi:hypothetical protein
VENTTFGSGFQIAAHSSSASSSDASCSAVLPVQHRLVEPSSHQVNADFSDFVDPRAEGLLVGRRPVEVAVRPDDVAVK